MTLYEKIQHLCIEHKITIAELERQSGLSRGVICNWKDKSPSTDRLSKVAKTLGVTMDYLAGLTNNPYSNELTDDSITSIQRARAKMSDRDKEKMDAILRLAFEKEFSELNN